MSTIPAVCESDIYDLLYRLGLTAESVSFFHTTYAVSLAIQQPELLLFVTKLLYPAVARQYHTNWRAVERSIRRAARMAWRNNPELLCELGRHHLYSCPSAGKFIAILSRYLSAKCAALEIAK